MFSNNLVKLVTLKNRFLMTAKALHCIRLCLTVQVVWHIKHCGCGSCLIERNDFYPGLIARNDYLPSEYETQFYYEKYGKYTNSLDRGKLNVPSDHTFQGWFISFFRIQQRKGFIINPQLTFFCLFLDFIFSMYRESMFIVFAYISHPNQTKSQLKDLKLS